jgi:hypothetical protein
VSVPTFYLGTHQPHWLGRTDVPLFVSRRRLADYKKPPRALGRWALDSGGFTELNLHGRWLTTPHQYALEVRRWRDEVGGLDWAACQDWMCESFVLQKTELTVTEHQARTVANYLELLDIDPELPWAPVLQGWKIDDYLRHADEYGRVGVNLASLPVVGVGSVCRRQDTGEAEQLIRVLKQERGLKVHGFGFKKGGLIRCVNTLHSADSMAWSYHARRHPPLPGHTHKNCANCMEFALKWRASVVADVALASRKGAQIMMF